MQQKEYETEGIISPKADYPNNLAQLELLHGKPSGVFRMLEEECRIPKGNELAMVEKLQVNVSLCVLCPPNPIS